MADWGFWVRAEKTHHTLVIHEMTVSISHTPLQQLNSCETGEDEETGIAGRLEVFTLRAVHIPVGAPEAVAVGAGPDLLLRELGCVDHDEGPDTLLLDDVVELFCNPLPLRIHSILPLIFRCLLNACNLRIEERCLLILRLLGRGEFWFEMRHI